jgi:outer membrane receptor for ferrienterochelin and colicin
VGLLTQEVPVSDNMRVVLQSDSELLDEVVVVGYGTQRRENLTGAVSSVNVEDAVANRPVTDIAKALQGISPGLTITNNLGGVGTESTIRLRGSVGSINATGGTSPLILVDGVEVPSLNLFTVPELHGV